MSRNQFKSKLSLGVKKQDLSESSLEHSSLAAEMPWELGSRKLRPASGLTLVSKDPIGFEGGYNLYAYANGDPINKIDPDGNAPIPLIFTVLAGVFYSTDLKTPDGATNEVTGVPLAVVVAKTAVTAGGGACKAACKSFYGLAKNSNNFAKIFGKEGLLNSNRYLRIGISGDGGNKVFRITGDLIGNRKIDLRNLGPL